MARLPEILLADANVLIDYVETDVEILQFAAGLFMRLTVPRPVLKQVPRLTPAACRKIGVVVIDAETEMLLEAAIRSPALGFQDSLCLILCERNKWTCVTNDVALARVCRQAEVPVRRGLNLMVELVAHSKLPTSRALAVARAIQSTNPFITETVVKEFERLILSTREK